MQASDLLSENPSTTLPTPNNDDSILPLGVGVLNWGADLKKACAAFKSYTPAAVWFFAPRSLDDLVRWTEEVRAATQGKTHIWVQVGTVAGAVDITRACKPEVLIVQGQDAGGHGLDAGAGLLALFPEVQDALEREFPERKEKDELPIMVAAGGIVEGRGAAAALALGAGGVVLGTRYLASYEANISRGYRDAVLAAKDGGVTTVRSGVYDYLRGTTEWPEGYGGRGVINQSYRDHLSGMSLDENRGLYEQEMNKGDEGWGDNARMTTYAGTGVGLVKEVMGAREITEEVREEAARRLEMARGS